MQLAQKTARIALPGRVAALQEIRRQWDAVTLETKCMADAKPHMREYMQQIIQVFLGFMGRDSELAQIDRKIDSLKSELAFLESVQKCNPNPRQRGT